MFCYVSVALVQLGKKKTYSEDDLGIFELAEDVHRIECPKDLLGGSRTCRLSQLGILHFTGFRDEQKRKNESKETHAGFNAIDDSPAGECCDDTTEKRCCRSEYQLMSRRSDRLTD